MTDVIDVGNVSDQAAPDIDSLPSILRKDFPILDQLIGGEPLAYLDNAATAQKPRAVLDSIVDYYSTTNSNVGRGYYRLSQAATDRYEEARAVVQDKLLVVSRANRDWQSPIAVRDTSRPT